MARAPRPQPGSFDREAPAAGEAPAPQWVVQYVVHAYDFPDALERRLACRERHLEGVRRMKAGGSFHVGGALLDAEGRMIGSMMLIEFPDDAAVHDWLREEVYVTESVWEKVDVRPFRMAPV